jgi:hypothetical protein
MVKNTCNKSIDELIKLRDMLRNTANIYEVDSKDIEADSDLGTSGAEPIKGEALVTLADTTISTMGGITALEAGAACNPYAAAAAAGNFLRSWLEFSAKLRTQKVEIRAIEINKELAEKLRQRADELDKKIQELSENCEKCKPCTPKTDE